MYSDRIASSSAGSRKRSIKDRLGTAVQNGEESSRQNFSKRLQGHDGKWQHDKYDDIDDPRLATRNEQRGTEDLRSKLKRTIPRNIQGGSNASSGIKDLREKLSGPIAPPQSHPQVVTKPQHHTLSTIKTVIPKVTTVPVIKPPMAAPKPLAAPKVTTMRETVTIADFLQSLGLSKYLITFQAEEIDMSVLRLMKDDELKELGIPMGPRKKIVLALSSQSNR